MDASDNYYRYLANKRGIEEWSRTFAESTFSECFEKIYPIEKGTISILGRGGNISFNKVCMYTNAVFKKMELDPNYNNDILYKVILCRISAIRIELKCLYKEYAVWNKCQGWQQNYYNFLDKVQDSVAAYANILNRLNPNEVPIPPKLFEGNLIFMHKDPSLARLNEIVLCIKCRSDALIEAIKYITEIVYLQWGRAAPYNTSCSKGCTIAYLKVFLKFRIYILTSQVWKDGTSFL
jgi:hypothetical protein